MFGVGNGSTFEMILGGLVAALFVFYISRVIKRRNETGEQPKGSSEDWLAFSMIMGGLVLFIVLLIAMVV